MIKLVKIGFFIFLAAVTYSQPLQFHDKIDSVEYTSMDMVADDKGGWLTLVSAQDSSFSMILFGHCGQVISQEKYSLPANTKLSTPQITYLGQDRFIVVATLTSSTETKILVFNYILGILSQVQLIATPNNTHNYNPLISVFDQDNILLGFNYNRDTSSLSILLMLSRNLNIRWSKNVTAVSHLKWIKMLNIKEFATGDGQFVNKYDTLGTQVWSRQLPDHELVFNSVLKKDTQIVFLADVINKDTANKLNYKQVIGVDLDGKLIWNSDRIRSLRSNHLLEYNNRLLFNNNKDYIFNAIDTVPGDSIPSVFSHTIAAHGSVVSSKYWSAKDSVIDYKSALLDDGNFSVGIILGHSNAANGFANIKTTQSYEGACSNMEFSDLIPGAVIIDSISPRNIPNQNITVQNISILGHTDSFKIKRECEIFDLKDGEVPTPLCKGDSVFLAGIQIPNASYEWNNGTKQNGIWVKDEGSYSVIITYCGKSATITYKVTFIKFANEIVEIEECDYPYRLQIDKGPRATYFWAVGETNNFININGPGTYTLTVTECEMPYIVTFNVNLRTLKDHVFTYEQCNFPDTLYANLGKILKGATYQWDNGTTTELRAIAQPGTYVVTISYCMQTYKQTFIVNPSIRYRDDTFKFAQCNYPEMIYADNGKMLKGATYLWDNGFTDNARLINGPGTYVATVTYCGYSYKQSFDIFRPVFTDNIFTYEQCNYPDIIFADLGRKFIGAKFSWDNGSTDNQRIIQQPGTYKATVNYCEQTFVQTIEVRPRVLNVQDSIKMDSCNKFPLTLKAYSEANNPDIRYQWNTSNKDTIKEIKIAGTGTYTVDIDYCFVTYRQKFTVTEIDAEYLKFPNVFPPNSEIVINKTYKPLVRDLPFIEDYRLEIYNRWGVRVFETNSPTVEWDGNYKGEPAAMDTYIYVASMRSSCGKPRVYKGSVTLIR